MKLTLIILFFLLAACTATREVPVIAKRASVTGGQDSVKWMSGNEAAVSRYLVEYGTDTLHYSVLTAVFPGKNVYSVPIPDSTLWIRVHSVGVVDFFQPWRLHNVSKNYVTISNALITSTYLKWTVANERNVSVFLIEKSLNGTSWSKTTQIPDNGNGTYNYRYSRSTRIYKYRLSVLFKDGTRNAPTIFK